MLKKLLTTCIRPKQDDRIFIISIEKYSKFAFSLHEILLAKNFNPAIFIVPSDKKGFSISTKLIKPIIGKSDIIISLADNYCSFTDFSENSSLSEKRFINLHEISEKSLQRIFSIERNIVAGKSRKVADILSIGKTVKIYSGNGTELHLSIIKSKGLAVTGDASNPGQSTSVPYGFCRINAVSKSASGKLYITGSFTGIGMITDNVKLNITEGKIKRIFGNEGAEKIRNLVKYNSTPLRDVLCVGVGTHPNAKFTGMAFEDKCVEGVVHITIGHKKSKSYSIIKPHKFDIVIRNATLKVDSMTLVKDGVLQV